MVSSSHKPIAHDLTDRKERVPVQTPYPKYSQPYLTVERESVYRRPGLEERRIIEVQEPMPGRRDSPPREHRQSSRSTNRPRHEMVLSQKSTLDPIDTIPALLTTFQVAVGAILLNQAPTPTTIPTAQARLESAAAGITRKSFP